MYREDGAPPPSRLPELQARLADHSVAPFSGRSVYCAGQAQGQGQGQGQGRGEPQCQLEPAFSDDWLVMPTDLSPNAIGALDATGERAGSTDVVASTASSVASSVSLLLASQAR